MGVSSTLIMVNNPLKQFLVYESILKKVAGNQGMNEKRFKHMSFTKLDKSSFQGCGDRQESFVQHSSVGSENILTTMCSDGSTNSTNNSSSFLSPTLSFGLLERSASPVESEELQKQSHNQAPVGTAPANCLSTTAINLVDAREICVTSRELHDYSCHILGPDTLSNKVGEEVGSLIGSSIGENLCPGKKLDTNGVVWNSIEAGGGSPIQFSKAQRISFLEELRRVAASFGQKARLLEQDSRDLASAVVNVQIEERMDLHLMPNTTACHVEPDKHVVRVFYEQASSEDSDPLGFNSDNCALASADEETAGNLSTSQSEDVGLDELQASSTNEYLKPLARACKSKPAIVDYESLPLIITSQIAAQKQTLTVWKDPLSSDGIVRVNSKKLCTSMVSVKDAKVACSSLYSQDYNAHKEIGGQRKGKRKWCEENTLMKVRWGTKPDGGLASPLFPSNYMEVCFECKGSLNSAEKVVCSRNDCDRVYHFSCTVDLSDVSWSCEGKLVCPQHVCYACGKSRGAKLWRCQYCSLATHESCIPCPEVTTLFHNKPGWAICWRHGSDIDNKLKTPTWDCQDIFRHLPVPEVQQEFSLAPEFIKEVMENDREPPPYFFIRRNVFLIKKKRDDADDGVGCSCQSAQDVCGDDCECRVQSMSCSKDCKCSDKCCNKPFRKDKRLKVSKVQRTVVGVLLRAWLSKKMNLSSSTLEKLLTMQCVKSDCGR
uniref:AWS domain-containing protein n=1 Tax=Physcomitrium patens TaxID=3218 RepID=A0A7I4FKW4_PHYPA